jgi:hypothetical protein
MSDPMIERIEAFRCRRGSLTAERRNRGYTLYNSQSSAPVARLRPTDIEGRFHVLYWSLWKERWVASGPLGPAKLSRLFSGSGVMVARGAGGGSG